MKRIAKWLGIVLGILILAAVILPFLIDVDQFRPALQASLSGALHREVKLGNLKLHIFAGEVTADDLSVAEDPAFGKPAFLSAKSLHVGVELWPFLFSRKLNVTNLQIDQPEIAMVQTQAGDWNFSTLGGKSAPSSAPAAAPLNLSVKRVEIAGGRVTLSRTVGHWKPLVLEQVNLHMQDFSATSEFPFSLSAQVRGGGSVSLEGKAGPVNPANTAMTPVTLSLKIDQLDLAATGANDATPDVTGLISFDGTGQSNGTTLDLKGKLKADKLKIAKTGKPAARTVEVDFEVSHDLRKHAGVVRRGDIHLGAALAHLTGRYAEQGEAMTLDMKLAAPGMPVQELEAMLPALGIVLPAGTSLKGGTLSAELAMEGPADRTVTSGTVSMNNTELVGFDLPKRMASIEKLAGIKEGPDTRIEQLSANVRSSPEGTQANDMKLVVPSIGELTGAGTVSEAKELNFKMSAVVHATGLLGVIGGKPIPFSVTGTAEQPVFKPDVGAVVKEELKGVGGGLMKGLLGGKKK